MSDQNLSPLHEAYRILAQLSHEAWKSPMEVPTPLALMLLRARDYVGEQLHQELVGPPPASGPPSVEPVLHPGAAR